MLQIVDSYMLRNMAPYKEQTTLKSNFISLLNPSIVYNIFQKVPRTFEIFTTGESCYFNPHILKGLSYLISETLEEDPDHRSIGFTIDNNRVLKKIEELCQGKLVTFKKKDLPDCADIVEILQIHSCPDFMKNRSHNHQKKSVIISPEFDQFLLNSVPITFIILTKKQEYCCNIFGIYSSEVISDFITANPNTNQFIYDYDDELNEFQQICNLFNFQEISITTVNLDSITKIAEDLKISYILDKLKTFSHDQDKMIEKIDQNEKTVDKINELFDLLYKIKQLSVGTVRNSIINSKWSKSEENVQEMASFILQVIQTDGLLHSNIMDLLFELDSENLNELKILMPLIKNKLLDSFDKTKNNCAFVYRLYQKGIIKKEELFSKLMKKQKNDSNVFQWFLPELIEIGNFDNDNIKTQETSFLVNFYLPDKIDLYKKMRDSFEPEDAITKSLRIDDVDTFQSIISVKQIKDISKCFVPYNIFDSFSQRINYINYASAFGSVKCFKYLMLNHSKIDSTTFYYAIYGGNSEIIKIVDNELHDQRGFDPSKFLTLLIRTHRNDLFDWFFESKINKYDIIYNKLNHIVTCSVLNGNPHALAALIDKGFNIFDLESCDLQDLAAASGYYHLLKYLYNICDLKIDEKSNCWGRKRESNYVSFGNLKIFKFFMKTRKQEKSFIYVLQSAIEKDEMKMINYFFDEHYNKITVTVISEVLNKALEKKSDELFYSFIDKFKQKCPSILEKYTWNMHLLETACFNGQIKPFYTIINLIKLENNNIDFTNCLYKASSSNSIELCKYIIDHKYKINYKNLFNRISSLPLLSYDIIILLFNNSGLEIDKSIFLPLLSPAIKNHNKNFVRFLLEKKIFYDEMLIDSVISLDVETVKIILEFKSNQTFVNRSSEDGTALHVAVKNNNLEIVKLLLSVPSINPYFYDRNNQTPLMIAISQINLPIINEFISFFGKDIIMNRESIDFLLESLFKGAFARTYSVNGGIQKDMNANIIKTFELLLNIENIQTIFDEKNQRVFLDICTKPNVDIKFVQKFLKIDKFNVNDLSISNGETLLTAAIKSQRIDIVRLLIEYPKTNVNMNNINFETPLHIAVKKSNLEIVQLLLSVPSINPNLYDKNNQTPLMIASYHLAFPIINEFISYSHKKNEFHKDSFNYLLEYLVKGSLGNVQRYNYNNRQVNQAEIKGNSIKMLENLINNEKNVFDFNGKNQKILLDICSKENVDLNFVQNFLKIDKININVISPSSGNTPLILSLKSRRVDIARLLINDPRTNINLTNFNHESALIIAVQNEFTSIVEILINDPRFDPVESRIDYAFILSSNEISELLLSMNLFDVNCNVVDIQRNHHSVGWGSIYYDNNKFTKCEETALIQAAKNKDLIKFEFIIKHPTFDKDKSKLQKATQILFEAKQNEILFYFVKILKNNNLLNYCFEIIESYISILNNGNHEILDEITNGKIDNLIIPDDFILKLFYYSLRVTQYSIKSMTFLIDYDKKHNNVIDFKNKSFLTHICRVSSWGKNSYKLDKKDVEGIVNLIIENGGDVNMPNKRGIYPLQAAINLEFSELVLVLIETKKVNYNQIITHFHRFYSNDNDMEDNYIDNDDDEENKKCTETYLHLASRISNSKIFKLILNLNVFDINAKNSNNETPLMLACENLDVENVKLLFKNDSLDFHCKNNKNEDALQIVLNIDKKDDEIEPANSSFDNLSKGQYLDKLIAKINEKNYDDDGNLDYQEDNYNEEESDE